MLFRSVNGRCPSGILYLYCILLLIHNIDLFGLLIMMPGSHLASKTLCQVHWRTVNDSGTIHFDFELWMIDFSNPTWTLSPKPCPGPTTSDATELAPLLTAYQGSLILTSPSKQSSPSICGHGPPIRIHESHIPTLESAK